uniref:Putative salivary secreted protein n=1 Tax=Ixodes scapularis TaxID=6945 RepID=Q4PMQ7_IXOSC|nr:putative salivary secreted protein [Ixodes scapularis]
MKGTSFYVLFCFFGAIICDDPPRCTSDAYDNYPGFAPGCTRNCTNNYEVEPARRYNDGVFCFASNPDGSFKHLGACYEGVCQEEPRGPNGQLPNQWADEYHMCASNTSLNTPVTNCAFICKMKREQHLPEGYFFGIFKHPSKCELGNGKIGVCASGHCTDPELYPKIDDGELKPSSK